MLVTFTTKTYPDITMFGDVATRLIKMMGASGTVPSAIDAAGVSNALARGIHILDLFLGRIRVVHAQITNAAELAGDTEVQADALGMADVEIAIRFGGEARVDARVFPLGNVLGDDVADKIRRRGVGGGWFGIAHFSRAGG
jgi:hypothetical protein